jgi:hypothetical protein
MRPKTSPKSKPSAATARPDWLDWEDGMLNHCRTLDTLAELLAHTGCEGVVKLEVVNDTGGMIRDEVTRLKKLVKFRPGREAAR